MNDRNITRAPLEVARASFKAYETKDRAALEEILADDFHFTSPLDNALDRETYLEICWPNSGEITNFEYQVQIEDGERAFVVYEASTKSGKRFRNAELHTVRDGKLVSVEVYFGWDLPHKAKPNHHVSRP